MSALSMLVLLITHPLEFRTLVQYKLWHNHDRDLTKPSEYENTGWNRETMKRCWGLLDLTSRSFTGVIKELDGELARMVSSCGIQCIHTIRNSLQLPVARLLHQHASYSVNCQNMWNCMY